MAASTGAGKAGVPDNKELAAFFEDMGMMIQSGISVTEAVSLLKEDSAGKTAGGAGSLHTALDMMNESIQSGAGLGEAMKETGIFPEYSIDLVETSEFTGHLEEALFQLSEYYVTEDRMKSALATSVRYPVILLIMVLAVLVVLLVMVFPSFYGVYNNLTGSLSASSYSYINISFALCRVMTVFIALITAAVLLGIYSWNRGGSGKVLSFMSQFRSVRELLESVALYRFSSCFSMFIAAGQNQDEAISRSIGAAGNAGVEAHLEHCRDLMAGGMSFSQAAYEEHIYDNASSRILMSAERSGMLDTALTKVTESLRHAAEEHAAGIANTAEPLMTGSLMIFIGLILISLMLPLIGIMNSIG